MKTNRLHLIFHCLLLITLSASLASVNADPLDNWTSGNVNTNSDPFTSIRGLIFEAVTYGNGRYVEVGEYPESDNATIQTSDDGTNWTLRTHNDFSVLDLFDVTYGNGLFVAVGWDALSGRNIYSSTNGINWTPHTTSMDNVFGVTYGGGYFVAVGDGVTVGSSTQTSDNIYTSPDGTNWTVVDTGVLTTLQDISYGNGRFVAVDNAKNIFSATPSDLVDWSVTPNSLAGNKVSFCNGRFLISAGKNANLISLNGLSWSTLTNNTGGTFGHVIYTAGTYVALAGSNVFSSSDATNWIQRGFVPPANLTLNDLVAGPRNVMLTGYITPTLSYFMPVAYLSDPLISLGMSPSFPPQLTIAGLTNKTCRIDMATNLLSGSWQPLTNLALSNSPVVWTDTQATNGSEFYRAVLLP